MRNIIIATLLIGSITGCKPGTQPLNPLSKNSQAIPVKLQPIQVDTSINQIAVTGLLATENEARLSFKVAGIIESILVQEGDVVKKGQVLAVIQPTEIAAQVQQVQLSVEKAERDYQRAGNLYRDSVATLEQLQNAQTGRDIARQSLQAARFNQQYARIYAPADGFIVKKMGNAGELASVGTPVLVMNAYAPSSHWIVKAGVSDLEWAAAQLGNVAEIKIDAFPSQTFRGIVSKKSLAADPITGSFQIEIQMNPGAVQPAIGMFASASIQCSGKSIGYPIPYESLLETNGRNGFVFVTDDKKTVQRVAVTVNSIQNDQAYVTDGLQGHAFIVTAGSPYLTDGSIILPQ